MSIEDPTSEVRIGRLLRRQLKAADHALARLNQKDPGEALHDFRVALRRIRTCLRPHRDEIKSARSLLRKLRKLMHASDAARDAQVWLALLDTLAEGCRPQEYEGIVQIRNRLSDQLIEAMAQANEVIQGQYTPVRNDLAALTQAMIHDRLEDLVEDDTALKKQLCELWQLLDTALCTLLPGIELDSAHRARLLTKRLRYILESKRDLFPTPEIDDMVIALKSLQTLLGEWRDAMLLGDWLTETAAICCGVHARKMVHAAMHDDVHGFAVLQAHELLSGLVYLATRMSAHLAMLRGRLESWLGGADFGHLQTCAIQLIAAAESRTPQT